MFRSILAATLISILAVPFLDAPAGEKPAGPDVARAARDQALRRAENRYRKALVAAEKTYLAKLEESLKRAMEGSDLEAVNEVDRARREAKARLAALTTHRKNRAVAGTAAPLPGKYSVHHRDWRGEVTLYADGRFGRPGWGQKHRFEGAWTWEAGVLTLHWEGWGPESFTPRLGFFSSTATMVRTGPVPGDAPAVRESVPAPR